MSAEELIKQGLHPQSPSPCPPTGPAHDGRGAGRGIPGGTRRGIQSPRPPERPGHRSPNPRG